MTILAAALFLAGASWAQEAPKPQSLKELLRSAALKEDLLHAHGVPKFKRLGGFHDTDSLAGSVPEIDASGGLFLPPKYEKEYSIPADDLRKLKSILGVAKKYADAEQAVAEGYLMADEYEDGVGLAFARPDLASVPRLDLAKPALLLYVKARGESAFFLAGVAYLSTEKTPPQEFRIARAGGEPLKLWRPWEGICYKARGGVVTYRDAEDEAKPCADGRLVPKAWIMHVWLPLYNPLGLFTPRNPVVDYLDLSDRAFTAAKP